MIEEETLWLSVLVQQFEDLTSTNETVKRQAKAWFEASIGTSVADFEQVCEWAGYHPDTIRKVFVEFTSNEDKKTAFKSIRKAFLRE